MSKIENGGLDQYGAGPFEQQQFGTAGVERVNLELHGITVMSADLDRPGPWSFLAFDHHHHKALA